MKKILSVILLLAVLLLGGCNSKPTARLSEQFLLKLYTANDIASMQASLQKLEDSTIDEEDTLEFHKPLAEFMTDEGLKNIILTKGYYNIYKMVSDGAATWEPFDIKLEENEGSINFSLTVKVKNPSNESAKEIKQTGQLAVSDVGKIDGIYFDNLYDLQK